MIVLTPEMTAITSIMPPTASNTYFIMNCKRQNRNPKTQRGHFEFWKKNLCAYTNLMNILRHQSS